MRYPKFRRQHLFVASGVIEGVCKTVIAARLKQSGMFWTIRGANAILARQPPQRAVRTILGEPIQGGLTTTAMSHIPNDAQD